MEKKTEFTAQHYYLKWLAALPTAIIAILIQVIIAKLITNHGLIFYLLYVLIFVGIVSAYYYFADRTELFQFKGYFSVSDDIIKIELEKDKYEIKDVTTLLFGEIKVFASKYPYITIKTADNIVKIYGSPLKRDEKFADSDLVSLSASILEINSDLEQKTILDEKAEGWYEKKTK